MNSAWVRTLPACSVFASGPWMKPGTLEDFAGEFILDKESVPRAVVHVRQDKLSTLYNLVH